MPGYLKPNLRADYRVDAAECMDRAQRALELAETNLDNISDQINRLGATPNGVNPGVVQAHADARIALGQAWRDLAALKSFETER